MKKYTLSIKTNNFSLNIKNVIILDDLKNGDLFVNGLYILKNKIIKLNSKMDKIEAKAYFRHEISHACSYQNDNYRYSPQFITEAYKNKDNQLWDIELNIEEICSYWITLLELFIFNNEKYIKFENEILKNFK